jgi:MoaA/NifB/PqqE/SkfB family radical SAM enzyme
MLKLDQVRRVHVELTTRCNARCPMCMRNYRGYDYNSGYPLCDLSFKDFKHILPPERFPGISHVNFNGNLGDFANAKDAVEIVKYLVDLGATVSINTNGSLRSPAWWARLAHPKVTIGFAIDGLADTHALYRQDTDWHRIIENATTFIKAGGRAIWRFVPFEHNRHQQAECEQMSRELGFVEFENIYDGRESTPVYTRSGEFSHQIGQPFDTTTPKLKDMLISHITWFDHKTVRVDRDLSPLNLQCVHKLHKEIYIAADGSVYPCCFLGFYPATMKHPGNDQLLPMIQENNALEYDLEHCLEWFDQVEESWSKDSIASGRLYQCVNSCGRIT